MPEQADLAQVERAPHGLDILNHVLDGVSLYVLQLLRLPRSALVNKHQSVMARQRKQIRQEVVMRCTRSAMHDHQRLAASEKLVIDHYSVRVYETSFLRINGRGDSPSLSTESG